MSKPSSIETDLALNPKVVFLNSVFLFAGIVAFGMGFVRWQVSVAMGAIDFVFSLCAFALVYYLNRHKERVETISSIALVLAYGLFTAIYLLAPYNTTRISLFFLLSASVFFLKGRQAGLAWLIIILLTIIIGHFLPGFDTAYSHIDIVTTSLYLLALLFIFFNYEIFKEKVNERDRDKEVLRLSEDRFRTMVENGNDIIGIISNTGTVRFISPSVEPVLGFEPGEMINKNVNDLIHPDEKPKAAAALANALAHPGGETLERYEFLMKHKNGSYRDIEMVGRNLISNTVIGGIVLNGRDITERKREVQALRESEARFHALVDVAGDLIFTIHANGEVRYVNEMAARALHTVPEQVIGKHLSDLFPPETFEPQWRNLQKVFETGEPLYVEAPTCFPYGEVWLSTWLTPLRDTSGSIVAVLGASRDITERKQAEEEMRLRTQLLDSANDAIFVHDLDGNFIYLNEVAWKSRGYTRDELMGMNLHALDVPEYEKLIEARGRELMGKGPGIFESAHRRKDGSVIPIEISARLIESGGRKLVISAARDITERKQAEAALRSAHEEVLKKSGRLEKFQQVAVDREMRMVEMKEEVNGLLERLGEPRKYVEVDSIKKR